MKRKINRKTHYSVIMLAAVTTLVLASGSIIFAGGITEMPKEDYDKVSLGGLLYDNWSAVTGVKTEGIHPSYPAEGKKKGGSTWRCKECHGWDYMGKDGAYAKGSHYTGIKGIRDSARKSPEKIATILKDKTHAYGGTLSAGAYEALAYFVAYGQVAMERFIDRSTKKANGNAERGAKIYTSTCAKCHGADGRKLNFKTADNPEYLGTIANKNPWEALHKIRFGQPMTEMPSLLFLDIGYQINVLSYCQTLPLK